MKFCDLKGYLGVTNFKMSIVHIIVIITFAKMYDTLINDLGSAVVDSTDIICYDTISKPAEIITFFQQGSSSIVINELVRNNISDTISYVLIGLLTITALIWYLVPDRIISLFRMGIQRRSYFGGESQLVLPGKIIVGFLWVVTIVAYSVLIFDAVSCFFPLITGTVDASVLLKNILLLVLAIAIIRVVFIYFTSFIFNTKNLLVSQLQLGGNIHLVSGVVLLPLLIIVQYSYSSIFLPMLLVLLLMAQVFRVIVIIRIGKTSSMFTALHIILYLCTLEIVPILVLLRLIETRLLM